MSLELMDLVDLVIGLGFDLFEPGDGLSLVTLFTGLVESVGFRSLSSSSLKG